jgi:hypothetical protein
MNDEQTSIKKEQPANPKIDVSTDKIEQPTKEADSTQAYEPKPNNPPENWCQRWINLGFDKQIELVIATVVGIVAILSFLISLGLWRASNISANAAKAAVKAAQDASRLDQRAWVTVQRLKLEGGLTILASLANTGKTPATFTYKFQTETGEPTWKHWESVPQTEGPQVIFPGDIPKSISVPLDSPFPEPVFPSAVFPHPTPAVIFVRFRIEYLDIFGCAHFTEVCAFHSTGEAPDIFSACKTGNAIDEKSCPQSVERKP